MNLGEILDVINMAPSATNIVITRWGNNHNNDDKLKKQPVTGSVLTEYLNNWSNLVLTRPNSLIGRNFMMSDSGPPENRKTI